MRTQILMRQLLSALLLTSLAAARDTAMVVDGQLDDPVWRGLAAEKLTPSQPGVAAEMGGEVRLAIVGRFLYLSARLPEPGCRVTARVVE